MPVRKDREAWTDEEDAWLREQAERGVPVPKQHRAWPNRFPRRTLSGMRMRRQALSLTNQPNPDFAQKGVQQPEPDQHIQSVEVKENGDELLVTTNGLEVRTLDELVARAKVDLKVWEVERPSTRMWEVKVKDDKGKVRNAQNFYLSATFKRKLGPNIEEQVRAVLDANLQARKPVTAKYPTHKESAVLQGVVIADPHLAKYAWPTETGGKPYDLMIAATLVRQAAAKLLADGDRRGVGRRAIWILGDYFHYDTPSGTTTGGTAMDRDGRVPKMIREGAAVLYDIIEQSAKHCQTDVVLVPGNHDYVLTYALREALSAYFRNDERVTVDAGATTRKYVEWGRCLIGLTHGDKARKRLGELMAAEVPEAWGRSVYREVHTGHLHAIAEVQSVAGVVVRTAPSLSPPDGWHALEGFVGSVRGMEAFYYHKAGALVGMTMANPDADIR